jgi:hypothetical protein
MLGSRSGRVKPKTDIVICCFSTKNAILRNKSKDKLLGIRIMCQIGQQLCPQTDCYRWSYLVHCDLADFAKLKNLLYIFCCHKEICFTLVYLPLENVALIAMYKLNTCLLSLPNRKAGSMAVLIRQILVYIKLQILF